MSKEEFDPREAAVKVAQQQVDSARAGGAAGAGAARFAECDRCGRRCPTPACPNDINESFPGVKYVVASAAAIAGAVGFADRPQRANADKIVEKIGALVASSFIDHVPAVEVAEAQLRQAQAALGGQSFDRGHPYNQPSVVQAQKELGPGRVGFELYRTSGADRRIRQRPLGQPGQPGASGARR